MRRKFKKDDLVIINEKTNKWQREKFLKISPLGVGEVKDISSCYREYGGYDKRLYYSVWYHGKWITNFYSWELDLIEGDNGKKD